MCGWCCCTIRCSASAYPKSTRRQCVRRPLHLQSVSFGTGSPRLCRGSRAGRDRELSGFRPIARDAGLPALCARLSPRIRAQCAESLARRTTRPVFLRPLRRMGARVRASMQARLKAADRREHDCAISRAISTFPPTWRRHSGLPTCAADGDLRAFLDWRCTCRDIAGRAKFARQCARMSNVAVIPSVARPTAAPGMREAISQRCADAAGIIEACFYEPGASRVKADSSIIKRRLSGTGRLRGILRPAYPDFRRGASSWPPSRPWPRAASTSSPSTIGGICATPTLPGSPSAMKILEARA